MAAEARHRGQRGQRKRRLPDLGWPPAPALSQSGRTPPSASLQADLAAARCLDRGRASFVAVHEHGLSAASESILTDPPHPGSRGLFRARDTRATVRDAPVVGQHGRPWRTRTAGYSVAPSRYACEGSLPVLRRARSWPCSARRRACAPSRRRPCPARGQPASTWPPQARGALKGGRMNDAAWREEPRPRSTSIRFGDRPVARGSQCPAA